MANKRQRNIQELNELLGKDKYKRTPGQVSKNRLSSGLEAAMRTRKEREKRLGLEPFKKRSKKQPSGRFITNKKAGGKVGSKNNAKKGGAPHNRLY